MYKYYTSEIAHERKRFTKPIYSIILKKEHTREAEL